LSLSLADFEKAIELDPNAANAHNNLGFTKSRLKDFEGAIEHFNRALNLDSSLVLAYKNRGYAKIKTQQTDDGCADLRFAIDRGDSEAETLSKKYCGGERAKE
jgi:lipoprotein NlpI